MAAVGLSPHFPLLQVKPRLHRENSERHQAVLFYVHSKKLLSPRLVGVFEHTRLDQGNFS